MDLLAYEAGEMYFTEPLDPRAEASLDKASKSYGEPQAEDHLRQAQRIAPEHLTVLVALYRYHFYRHQHAEALTIAAEALVVVAERLKFSSDWRSLSLAELQDAAATSAELVRFYLQDRKSTRLNSSHRCISYAVFCLKKKK